MIDFIGFLIAVVLAFIMYFIAITLFNISGIAEFSANDVAVALSGMFLICLLDKMR